MNKKTLIYLVFSLLLITNTCFSQDFDQIKQKAKDTNNTLIVVVGDDT